MYMSHRKLYILLIAILSGFIITVQLKSNTAFQGPVTIANIFSMQQDIENLEAENERIRNSNTELISKYEAYLSGTQDQGSIREQLEKELIKMKDDACLLQTAGPGIIITLNDSLDTPSEDANPAWYVIHDADILNIINELRASGAEAIAINDERVTAVSNIRCGGPTINIDGSRHATPFVIKAIGDPKRLEASAFAPDNYIASMEFYGIRVDVKKVERVVINGYNGPKKMNYQKRIEGGETK